MEYEQMQDLAHHTKVLREAMQAQLLSSMEESDKDKKIMKTLGMDLITKMQSQVVPDEAYVAMARSIEQQVLKDAGKEIAHFTEAALPILIKSLTSNFEAHIRDNLSGLIKDATESKVKAYTNLEHSSVEQLERMMQTCSDQMKRLTEAHDNAIHEEATMRIAGTHAGGNLQDDMADAFTYSTNGLTIK